MKSDTYISVKFVYILFQSLQLFQSKFQLFQLFQCKFQFRLQLLHCVKSFVLLCLYFRRFYRFYREIDFFVASDKLLCLSAGIVLKLVKRGSQVFVNRSNFVNFINAFFIVRNSGLCLFAERSF